MYNNDPLMATKYLLTYLLACLLTYLLTCEGVEVVGVAERVGEDGGVGARHLG